MTEYDYSPEAVQRYQNKMRGIHDWVRQTQYATSPSSSPPRSSPPRISPTYIQPRSMPLAAPIPIPIQISQPYLHSQPRTSSTNDHHHPHSHHHHSRSRDDGRAHSRSRTNSVSSRPTPSRSRTYSYAVQPQSQPYAGIPVVAPTPRRNNTSTPVYSGQYPNAQYVTYDPNKPIVINGTSVRLEYPYGPTPTPAQPRQAPLLKRLFTSLAWRPSARPQSAQLETRPPPGYSHNHTHSHQHSRAKSRDSGRDRERDRRRRRRSSLP